MRTMTAGRHALVLGAAITFAGLLTGTAAKADSLSVVGGTPGQLTSSFNPNWDGSSHDGVGNGTPISIFNNANASQTIGLFATPTPLSVTFEYLGYEAGDTDSAYANFTFNGTVLFTNQNSGTAVDTTMTETLTLGPNGLLPFSFLDSSTNTDAVNGGPVSVGAAIAFAQIDDQTVYAFFDDGGGGPDADYDDMVVKITVAATSGAPPGDTPLPATWPLLAGGLGVVGLLARRRKRKHA